MHLVRLIYCSKVERSVGMPDVNNIIAKAREVNQSLGISGILSFDTKYFLQALEGGRSAVSALYNKIATDKRHTDITLLSFEAINERLFTEWGMVLAFPTEAKRKLFYKYSSKQEYDPANMTAESALKLLISLNQ